jgi:hypothetical protein
VKTKIENMVGQRYGRLLVIGIDTPKPKSAMRVKCRCDCGAEKSIVFYSLRDGATRSCGCLWLEKSKNGLLRRTHGKTGTKIFNTYNGMKNRCLDHKNKEYKNYGGRGITVCKRWLSGDGNRSGFECFLSDMGEPSNELSLERINVDGNYESENCKWASAGEQAVNKRNTARDGSQIVRDLALKHGIKYHTIMDRFRRGERGKKLIRPTGKRWHVRDVLKAG